VRIFRERGNRGGKTVTVVRGLPERGPTLDARLGELRLCGAEALRKVLKSGQSSSALRIGCADSATGKARGRANRQYPQHRVSGTSAIQGA
jgi:hypothetical protein